ncbi:MAG: hypothetical protein JXR36_00060 [Bacteroidales bacterium]|nr:hypothetical protein [Bacteroidales bacterium]
MKLQDKFPYDSAIWGLENLYTTVGVDSFYINNSCVIAKNHTITTGHSYMLVHHLENGQITTQLVRLVDVYNDNVNINLVLCDKIKDDSISIQLNVRDRNNYCPWQLIDINFFRDEIDRLMIKMYCNC